MIDQSSEGNIEGAIFDRTHKVASSTMLGASLAGSGPILSNPLLSLNVTGGWPSGLAAKNMTSDEIASALATIDGQISRRRLRTRWELART
jgi:hypothetical protein